MAAVAVAVRNKRKKDLQRKELDASSDRGSIPNIEIEIDQTGQLKYRNVKVLSKLQTSFRFFCRIKRKNEFLFLTNFPLYWTTKPIKIDEAKFAQEGIFFRTPNICLIGFINKKVGY